LLPKMENVPSEINFSEKIIRIRIRGISFYKKKKVEKYSSAESEGGNATLLKESNQCISIFNIERT